MNVGVNSMSKCCCCLEEINLDQGVSCPRGHYFCAASSENVEPDCFANLIESQIPCMKAQNEALLCPICKQEFESRLVAARVSNATWGKLRRLFLSP